MTITTTSTAIDLLVELDRLGVCATLKDSRISLQPASRVPADLLAAVREGRSHLATLLADPRRRWKEQAHSLLAAVDSPALREDLQHLFGEREAIGSVDGGLDDDLAGQLAYRELSARLIGTASTPEAT